MNDVSQPAKATSAELAAFLRKVLKDAKFGEVTYLETVAGYDIEKDKQTMKVLISLES